MDLAHRNRLGLTPVGTGGAVLAGFVIGLGVLFYVREARTAKNARTETLAAATATPTAVPTPRSYYNLDAGAFRAPAGSAKPEAKLGLVRLVVPGGARIYADGQELPAGTTTVARPETGIVSILVKAEGRRDTPLVVEASSPDEIKVEMPPAPASATAAPTTTASVPGTASAARKPPRTSGGDVPPNPYQ